MQETLQIPQNTGLLCSNGFRQHKAAKKHINRRRLGAFAATAVREPTRTTFAVDPPGIAGDWDVVVLSRPGTRCKLSVYCSSLHGKWDYTCCNQYVPNPTDEQIRIYECLGPHLSEGNILLIALLLQTIYMYVDYSASCWCFSRHSHVRNWCAGSNEVLECPDIRKQLKERLAFLFSWSWQAWSRHCLCKLGRDHRELLIVDYDWRNHKASTPWHGFVGKAPSLAIIILEADLVGSPYIRFFHGLSSDHFWQADYPQ